MKNTSFKPMTIVFKVSDNIKEMMIKHYEDMKCEKTPPYAIFQVKDYDCVTTLYESGKVMFQGIGADIESSFWKEQERVLNNRVITEDNKDKKKKDDEIKTFINVSSIGSDEVGTGDYFGPLVVTASYVPKDKFSMLTELGVRDSKKLNDEKILKIGPTLVKDFIHTSIILTNKEYNQKYSNTVNMNRIKAILHNKCLVSVKEKIDDKDAMVVVDQFEPPKSYYAHLNETPVKITNINFMTKAEDQCFSVAVSSIISRYIFLTEMKKLSDKYGMIIPLGASNLVDEVGSDLVKKYGKDVLKEIAKYNFKNTDKILKK